MTKPKKPKEPPSCFLPEQPKETVRDTQKAISTPLPEATLHRASYFNDNYFHGIHSTKETAQSSFLAISAILHWFWESLRARLCWNSQLHGSPGSGIARRSVAVAAPSVPLSFQAALVTFRDGAGFFFSSIATSFSSSFSCHWLYSWGSWSPLWHSRGKRWLDVGLLPIFVRNVVVRWLAEILHCSMGSLCLLVGSNLSWLTCYWYSLWLIRVILYLHQTEVTK